MTLTPIGDIATAALSESGLQTETITWETSTDWDNAVSESDVEHSADIVSMVPEPDTFEDLSDGATLPSGYTKGTGTHEADTADVFDGSVCGLTLNGDASNHIDLTVGQAGYAPTTFSYYYRETANGGGYALKVYNGSGNLMFAVGTSNPGVGLWGASGDNGITGSGGINPDYGAWRRFDVDIDYANDSVTATWVDVEGSSSASNSSASDSFVNSASEIGRAAVGGDSTITLSSGGLGGAAEGRYDGIPGVFLDGSITTDTKSFSSSSTPDLQNLSYTLNGQSIVLDIIGSPGTASEEIRSQTLDGATSYTLTWSNSHTDFRVKPNLSSPDRDSEPTVDRVELVTT